MSTYVQSESSRPTARDLLNLLHLMEFENPRALDKQIGFWDTEMEDFDRWYGVLIVRDDVIGLTSDYSDAAKEEYNRQRRRMLEDERWKGAPVDPNERPEVAEAREKGLLP
jgi:hypothetical protein